MEASAISIWAAGNTRETTHMSATTSLISAQNTATTRLSSSIAYA